MENQIKKVAAIHDLSGIGLCSLTAAIPILSSIGVRCNPFPTAILSCQTAYHKFSFLDLTNEMKNYKRVWNEMNIIFDCVYSGFLGSINQIDIVREFIENQKEALIIIDPVMGDNGVLYDIYDKEMCNAMRKLVEMADVVTPNLTEACILLGKEYKENIFSRDKIIGIAKEISCLGPKKVVISGCIEGNKISNYGYDREKDEIYIITNEYNSISYSGTGDIFASIITGMMVKGKEFKESIEKASSFIFKGIEYTKKFNTDPREGIIIENILKDLID